MITITITDAANEDPQILETTADYLCSLSTEIRIRNGDPQAIENKKFMEEQAEVETTERKKSTLGEQKPLHANHIALVDNAPNPECHVLPQESAAQAFGGEVGNDAPSIVVANVSPTAPVVPPVSLAPLALELDVNGTLWDERIHSKGRSKLSDGSWRIRRGVSDEEAAAHRTMFISNQTVPIAPQTDIPPPPLVPPIPDDDAFGVLMDRIKFLTESGALPISNVPKIVTLVPGAVNLSNVAKNPQVIPAVLEAINKAVGGTI